jgi:hypothetical protein
MFRPVARPTGQTKNRGVSSPFGKMSRKKRVASVATNIICPPEINIIWPRRTHVTDRFLLAV